MSLTPKRTKSSEISSWRKITSKINTKALKRTGIFTALAIAIHNFPEGFAVIAGIIVFISLDELLPAAKTYDKAHDSLYRLIAGMAIMALSLNLLGQ